MNPVILRQRIAFLILKQRLFILKHKEREELDAWLAADEKHPELYERLSRKNFQEDSARYKHIDSVQIFERYRQKYPVVKPFLPWLRHGIAAMIILLMGFSLLLFVEREKGDGVAEEAIVPGCAKALLVLGDGSSVNLTGEGNQVISATGEVYIENTGTLLDYKLMGGNNGVFANAYNELITPVGGEYTLTMSDGTRVWLNSDSKLKYLPAFGRDERRVFLDGEAYFEVQKDSSRPFRVVLNDKGCIEVLGTSFNVSAYGDDSCVVAILEEGRVKMSSGSDSVVMCPGHKGMYMLNERQIVVSEVEAAEYTSWRKGEFVFCSESMGSIMKKLARWYGFEVEYGNEEVKKVLFSGKLKRYESITTLLNAMELSGGVRFSVVGHKICVQ